MNNKQKNTSTKCEEQYLIKFTYFDESTGFVKNVEETFFVPVKSENKNNHDVAAKYVKKLYGKNFRQLLNVCYA